MHEQVRNMGGIMASSEPLIQEGEVSRWTICKKSKSIFLLRGFEKISNVPDILKPRDIRVKDPSELNPSNLTQALKEVGRPDVETNFKEQVELQNTFTIGPNFC